MSSRSSAGHRLTRPNTVICKCKSHCTLFNPVTGAYEGDGHSVPRNTRDQHVKDDKRHDQAITIATTPLQFGESALASQGIQNGWIQRIVDEIPLLSSFPVTARNKPLVFKHQPASNGVFQWPGDLEITIGNHGTYALAADESANQAYLAIEQRLCELFSFVRHSHDNSEPTNSLLDRLHRELCGLNREKEIEWSQQRIDPNVLYVSTESYFSQAGPKNPFVKAACILTLILENMYFVPRRALSIHLAGMRTLARISGATPALIDTIPVDPRTLAGQFSLDPVTRHFISCPSCHCLYPYNLGDTPSKTISRCTYLQTRESMSCNAFLWKQVDIGGGRMRFMPTRKYQHQDLKHWLGRLLARPGMEDLLDNPYVPAVHHSESTVDDIWQSQVFADLRDSDGNLFFPAKDGEGRLVFTLSVDGFNPFHNKTAKQTVSSSGIWLVLLNLPTHLRYLPENICLAGVIPGPDKPSIDKINHYLALVVKDFLEFWHKGFFFSRTYRQHQGRLFKGMLIPLVCDMLAARQVISQANAPTSHNFCTFCDLDIDDIDIMDRSEWPAKDPQSIRHHAQLWNDASNEKSQAALFEAYGVRWSALFDLPYWNPVLYTVVDSMHALDLNLLQNQCRTLFQIDTHNAGGDGFSSQSLGEVEKRVTSADHIRLWKKCRRLISTNPQNLFDELLKYPRKVLYTICVDNNIREEGRQSVVGVKWLLAGNVQAWRQKPGYNDNQLLNSGPVSSSRTDLNEDPEDVVEIEGSREDSQPPPAPDDTINSALVARIVRHLTDSDDQAGSREKAYGQGTASIFSYLCHFLDIGSPSHEAGKKSMKRALFGHLISSVDDDAEKLAKLRSLVVPDPPDYRRAVLGKDVMEEIWSDMERTQLPKWITSVPTDWGTARRGKLSANQWRTICTIHLPITLVRLWAKESGRKKELLDHFMDLVAAVRIANMRISSPSQVDSYRKFSSRYISKIQVLFPDQKLKPSHHAALHIADFLQLFGPVHSHSAPFFERYINFFHQINTNLKFGEMESTFMNTSARCANIRAMIADDDELRKIALEMVDRMELLSDEDARGSHLARILNPNAPAGNFMARSKATVSRIPADYYKLLCDCIHPGNSVPITPVYVEATFFQEISLAGICYSTNSSMAYRNSSIIFRECDTVTRAPAESQTKAGVIESIFQYGHGQNRDAAPAIAIARPVKEIYLVVKELVPADTYTSDGFSDPYKRYGFAGGYLCQSEGQVPRVIHISQVMSHFALTKMPKGWPWGFESLIHVLPVDRLMYSFLAAEDMSHNTE